MKQLVVVMMLVLSTTALADHPWNDYHWNNSTLPLKLEVIDNLEPQWEGFLDDTVLDWNVSAILDLTVVTGSELRRERKKCNPVRGAIKACNDTYGYNGWLGLAQIWLEDGHIVQGTAKVNDTYFNTTTYDDAYAKRHVLCQEVGHVFGLGHTAGVSCMNDKAGIFDFAYVSPNDHDYTLLEEIYYSHTDLPPTTGGGGGNPGNGGGNGRNRFGEHTTVQYLGNNTYLVTVMIPLPEHDHHH